jgi:hypothetical protein
MDLEYKDFCDDYLKDDMAIFNKDDVNILKIKNNN